jgi:hypothetical protein
MSYTLRITHYNPVENNFFDEAEENAAQLADRSLNYQSIYEKNNVDYVGIQTTFGNDGTYFTKTINIPGFPTIEAAETLANDYFNSIFIKNVIAPWNRVHLLKSSFIIYDENNSMVKTVHDSRSQDIPVTDEILDLQPYVPE